MKSLYTILILPLLFLGTNLHAQDTEEILTEKLAELSSGFENVEVELFKWPAELHDNLGAMHEFAYVTRSVESTSGKLPLIISLHGGGPNWWNLSLEEQIEISADINKKRGYDLAELAGKELIMLEPNTTADWQAEELDRMLDYVLENFPDVDTDRVYVIGYSKGGQGTWTWLNASADRFTAAAIGGASGGSVIDDVTMLVDLPLWLIVGGDDSPAPGMQNMVNQLTAAGNVNVEYTVIDGADHREAGDVYFSSVEMVDWLLGFPVTQPEVKCDSTYAIIVEEDITYAEGLSHDGTSPTTFAIPLKLDVYVPDNDSENRPVYMFIHGGAFSGGSKTQAAIVEKANYFASRGWVFVSIDYRLTGDLGSIFTGIVPQEWLDAANLTNQARQLIAMYTAQRDAKAAMRWIVANADNYNINTDYITVGGGSAGAITAITLGISNQEDFRDEISLTDDPTLATTNLDQTYEIQSIVDFWGSNAALEVYEIIYGAHRFDNNDPPLFIAHGTADPTVLFSEAEELVRLYDSTGVHVELNTLEGRGHGPWGATLGGKSLSDLSFEFLVEQQGLILDDCDNMPVELSIKVYLQGAYEAGSMRTDLSSILPLTEPYSAMSSEVIENANVQITTSLITNHEVVDWVKVQLRTTPTAILATRVGLLTKDGQIIDPETTNPLSFPSAVQGQSYYVVVQHRNHLGVMTENAVLLD